MHQILFSLGGHPVYSHETFVALGFLVGLAVFILECRRRRAWDDRLIPVIAGIVVGGAIGARLGGLADVALQHGPAAIVWAWNEVGRSILGGLAGAYAGALVGKRFSGYPFRTGDLFAPAVALGLAVGRIGCFLSEAPGRPTALPWAVHVDPSVPIPDCPGCLAGVGMHPSFLYEIAFLLAAFGALLWARRRVHGPGNCSCSSSARTRRSGSGSSSHVPTRRSWPTSPVRSCSSFSRRRCSSRGCSSRLAWAPSDSC